MRTNKFKDAVVFIKREKEFFAVPYSEFVLDENNGWYDFEVGPICEFIMQHDFDSLPILNESDIKKIFTYSDLNLIERFHENSIRNSFIVLKKGFLFEKDWFSKANSNIKKNGYNPELVAFWTYLIRTLVEEDVVIYKDIKLPRFCTSIKGILTNAIHIYKVFSEIGAPQILDSVEFEISKLPEKDNPSYKDLLVDDPDYINFAMRVIATDTHTVDLSKDELKIFKKGIQIGLENEYEPIMDYYAYCCYGGGECYECDWKKAEELFLKLIKNMGDVSKSLKFAEYCNSLGYIYYYGRTNNGKRQLDKARLYFERAALLGHAEAKMKLSLIVQLVCDVTFNIMSNLTFLFKGYEGCGEKRKLFL